MKIKINQKGRAYALGKTDEVLRERVKSTMGAMPGMTVRQLAAICSCSTGGVSKILNQTMTTKKRQPRFTKAHENLLLTIIDNGTHTSLCGIKREFEALTNETFSLSTFSSVLSRLCSKQATILIDPRKFNDENVKYYLRYCHWQSSLTPQEAMTLAFFDEARVDVTSG